MPQPGGRLSAGGIQASMIPAAWRYGDALSLAIPAILLTGFTRRSDYLPSTRVRSYFNNVTERDRIRHRYASRQGRVLDFTVQYEAEIGGEWYPVVRYDTAHGRVHKDILGPDGSIKQKLDLVTRDLNEAYTAAIVDLRTHWPAHRERFETDLGRRR